MARYRCYACVDAKGRPGRDFEAAGPPKCPACGADPALDPRHARVVQPVAVIHFDPPSGVPGLGVGLWACDKTKPVAGGGMATGDPLAVTCAACVRTPTFAQAMEGRGPADLHPDFAALDVPDPLAE
jgi:hypothetical protein